MNQTLAEKLIIHYFTQFTEGCDSIECEEPECRSNPKFSMHFNNANEAAYEAIKSSLNHPFDNHLCSGVEKIKINPKLRTDLTFLDSSIKKLINENQAESIDHVGKIMDLLMNPDLFPYVLQTSDLKLSYQNLAISDDDISDFILLIQKNYQKSQISSESFRRLLHSIINDYQSTFHHVRSLILLFCFEPFYTDGEDPSFKLISFLVRHVVTLKEKPFKLFFESLQKYPKILRLILDICQNVITLFIIQNQKVTFTSEFFCNLSIFLMNLRDVSSMPSEHPLPSLRFSNEEFTKLIEPVSFYRGKESPQFRILYSNPAILTLGFKNRIFHIEQEAKQTAVAQQTIREQLFLGVNDRNTLVDRIHCQLKVHRDRLIEDTINSVDRLNDNVLSRPLMVTFIGEEALDAGGVSREYFQLLTEQLFSPDYGMFVLVRQKYYWFNSLAREIGIGVLLYQTLGTVVALAVYNKIILPIRFPLLLYKKILGKKITLADLAEFDGELAKSMLSLLDMKRRGEDISDLCLVFAESVDKFGTVVEQPLVPNGCEIEVNNDNVEDYIAAKLDWITDKSIHAQYEAFEKGFKKLFNGRIFQLFAPDELDVLVSGEEIFEWEELQKNCRYKDGYSEKSRVVKWFWEVFYSFDNSMKKKFLLFTTGTDRAPVGGLANVGIIIQKSNDNTKLPVAHTCFNILCLPNYRTKAELKRRLVMALNETEGFGLI